MILYSDIITFLTNVAYIMHFVLYSVFVYCESFYRLIVPPPLKSLNDEIVLITGAANGIGKAICMEILRVTNGKAKLVCWDINKAEMEDTVRELKENGAKAFAYTVDVSNKKEVSIISEMVKREVGNVTMIINNAGIFPCVKLLDQTASSIERTLNINVLAHFWIIKEFLPEMIKQNSGHIVAIASGASHFGSRNLIAYTASKHAVHGYMESLEDELEEYLEKPEVKLTTVYPMWCNTSFSQNTTHSRFKMFSNFMEPQYVAETIVDGVRRNYPQIYIPSRVSHNHFARIQPYKIQQAFKKLVAIYAIPPRQ